jgi:hypothetical protein
MYRLAIKRPTGSIGNKRQIKKKDQNGIQVSEFKICRKQLGRLVPGIGFVLHDTWRRGGGALVDYLGLRAAIDRAEEPAT